MRPPRSTDPKPGLEAQYDSECPRCGEPIVRRADRIVFNRGRAIHVACASGGDEAA